MSKIIVDVGGIGISGNPGDVIKTYALGSCVGVMVFSPFMWRFRNHTWIVKRLR